MDKLNTRRSKSLSWLLRHGAPKINVPITDDGFVKLSDILTTAKTDSQLFMLSNMTLDDFNKIVTDDKKNRYKLEKFGKTEDMSSYHIRANQGHSFSVPNLELIEVDHKTCPYALHGTDSKSWKLISECGYLSVMSRDYMHFASDADYEKLGRKNSHVVLKFDIKAANDDGIKFYRAANGVILSKGIDGKLSTKYINYSK